MLRHGYVLLSQSVPIGAKGAGLPKSSTHTGMPDFTCDAITALVRNRSGSRTLAHPVFSPEAAQGPLR
jgi:hypothetical protein